MLTREQFSGMLILDCIIDDATPHMDSSTPGKEEKGGGESVTTERDQEDFRVRFEIFRSFLSAPFGRRGEIVFKYLKYLNLSIHESRVCELHLHLRQLGTAAQGTAAAPGGKPGEPDLLSPAKYSGAVSIPVR